MNERVLGHGNQEDGSGLGNLAYQKRLKTMRLRGIPLTWRRGKRMVRWLMISIVKGSVV